MKIIDSFANYTFLANLRAYVSIKRCRQIFEKNSCRLILYLKKSHRNRKLYKNILDAILTLVYYYMIKMMYGTLKQFNLKKKKNQLNSKVHFTKLARTAQT